MGLQQDTLLHEPRGTRRSWLPVGVGTLLAAVPLAGIVGLLSPALAWGAPLVLGLALVSMGSAEVLPRSRRWPAAILRIGSLAGFVLYAVRWFEAN